jgi:DNA-binding IclR family transcriptional regulator
MTKRTRHATGDATVSGAPLKADTQRSIQSVEFGFRLIRCLEEVPGSLSLKDLAARCEMPASKAHLYLVSFRRVGLVAQEEATGHYTLGPYALQLGLSSLRKLEVSNLARIPLQEFSKQTGEASYLAVWCNRGPCIVTRVDGPRPLPMTLQVGYVLPTVSSATGRIFLSYLSRAATASIVESELPVAKGKNARDKEAVLTEIIAETRKRGLAHTDGLLNLGFTALSAPVFSHDGSIAAAITLIGPSTVVDTKFDGKNATFLRAAAESLSVKIGWHNSK